MSTNAWILIALTAITLAALAALWLRPAPRVSSRKSTAPLPSEWPLVQRPIFSLEERALHRQLRAALPHHTILAKLPLVRVCQPTERERMRYWFNLLGPVHVSFIVCTENGHTLAALDIEKPTRPTPQRIMDIKKAVLEACRIRYIICRSDQLPTAQELQMLVPGLSEALRPAVPTHLRDRPDAAHTTLAQATRGTRPTTGESQWYDSGFSQDSFFAPEALRDPGARTTRPAPLDP